MDRDEVLIDKKMIQLQLSFYNNKTAGDDDDDNSDSW